MSEKKIIRQIHLRYILNSNADKAIEAEIMLKGGYVGRASSPMAILPGKREKKISHISGKEELEKYEKQIGDFLLQNEMEQYMLDGYLRDLIEQLGTDICLAISIAFAKAAAKSEGLNLVKYISILLGSEIRMKIPKILVPIFSGGVHGKGRVDSFQQIMVGINEDLLEDSYQISKEISNEVEERLRKKRFFLGIASSGGYLATGLSLIEKFSMLQEILEDVKFKNRTFVAVDVAAEHLKERGLYMLDGKWLSREEFYKSIIEYIKRFSIAFVEDPFDFSDVALWRRLKREIDDAIQIIGDDIFATQGKFIDSGLATGAVIKMNQVGNISDTLNVVKTLKKNKMTMCVSHRSYETEDTTMCDIAVAAASEYIKIGSVKKGERIIKYNQLLRLEEEILKLCHEEE